MPAPAFQASPPYSCAYCGRPLPLNYYGIEAWRTGNEFVCNEFCAEGGEARQEARAFFRRAESSNQPKGSAPTAECQSRSREVRRKIEYLRSLRLAAQARGKRSSTKGSTD